MYVCCMSVLEAIYVVQPEFGTGRRGAEVDPEMRHLTLGFGSKQALLWQKQERNGPEPEKVPQSHGKGRMDLDGLGIPRENSLSIMTQECQSIPCLTFCYLRN